jgi:hypothetical protein
MKLCVCCNLKENDIIYIIQIRDLHLKVCIMFKLISEATKMCIHIYYIYIEIMCWLVLFEYKFIIYKFKCIWNLCYGFCKCFELLVSVEYKSDLNCKCEFTDFECMPRCRWLGLSYCKMK